MTKDPIVEEIHAIREEIAKRYNYDLDAIVEAMRDGGNAPPSHRVAQQHLPGTSMTDRRDFLKTRGEKVCVVGYCYGGSLAWLSAAKLEGLAAASSYYGSMVQANAALTPLCPTIVHLGRTELGLDAFLHRVADLTAPRGGEGGPQLLGRWRELEEDGDLPLGNPQ